MSEHVPAVSPELPSRTWRITLAALERLPQGALSRGFGALADTPIPKPLRRTILSGFAKALGIDTSEAELPIGEYTSLNDFFVRRLKPGLRSWPQSERSAGSPVDGIVGQCGDISAGTLVQAKGRWYTAAALLDDAQEARRYEHGCFVTLYLSPRHYHRIHAPTGGVIAQARHVPGRLLPVNAAAVAHVQDLFAVNERLVCYLDSVLGRIAVVAVGAYNVGRISAAFDAEWSPRAWVTNRRRADAATKQYDPAILVNAGDEIMAFHLGSTVVLLFEKNVRLNEALQLGQEVRAGSQIAALSKC